MIKILAIGNSFSQDATVYLHDIAMSAGMDTLVGNLCIGGCSLKTHWQNIQDDAALYGYEINGVNTEQKVSIKQALDENEWDYVTLQQASADSGIVGSYYPYATQIADYVKQCLPKTALAVHQTWAYEIDSVHSAFTNYNNNQQNMFNALCTAYDELARRLAVRLIPAGSVIQQLRRQKEFDYANGGLSLCCDGFHMHRLYGRYAVAATWFEFLLNGNIMETDYIPPTASYDDKQLINLIKQVVHKFNSDL